MSEPPSTNRWHIRTEDAVVVSAPDGPVILPAEPPCPERRLIRRITGGLAFACSLILVYDLYVFVTNA